MICLTFFSFLCEQRSKYRLVLMILGVVAFCGSVGALVGCGNGCSGCTSVEKTVALRGSIRLSLLRDRLLLDVCLEGQLDCSTVG